MSYAYDPLEDERRKKESQEEQSLGGGSGSVISGQNQAPQQQSGNKGSGQYTNLQKYLESNKGFGTDLANKADSIVGSAEKAQSDLDSRYRSDADKSSVRLDQENIDFVTSNPYAAQQGYNKETLAKKMAEQTAQQTPQQTAQQPTQPTQPSRSLSTMGLSAGPVLPGKMPPFVSKGTISSATTSEPSQQKITQTANPFLDKIGDPTESRKFITQRDAVYSGPNQNNNESYFANPRAQTREAQQVGSLLGSESGKKQLLNRFYGGDNKTYGYTPGQQNLDLLLVSQNPSAKQSFLQTQQRASQLDPKFQNLITELSSYGRQKEQETNAARKAARDAIGIDDSGNLIESGAVNNFKNYLAQQHQKAITDKSNLYQKLNDALQRKDISNLNDAEKTKLGLNDVYSLYNMNLVNPSDKNQLAYLQQLPDGMITQSSVSNTNDLNNANALAQLALIEQNWLDPKSVGSYDPNNSWSYDTSRFKNDLALKRNEYEKARMNLTTSYDNQYDRGGNIFQADVDDLIGLYGRYLQDYARGSDSKLFDTPNRAVNGTITMDQYSRDNYLKYYNQAVDAVKNLNQQMGQTDVLKAGRDNEYGDMSQYTKDDLMLGWKAYEPGIADWRDPNDAKNFELHEKLGHLQEGNLKGKPNTTGVASSAWGWGGRYYDKGSGEAMNPIKETWDQYFERLRRGDYSAAPGITFTK